MKLCVDYFNEITFGYDPILETWIIDKLEIQSRDNHINFNIEPGDSVLKLFFYYSLFIFLDKESVFNINLTQTFMTQFKRHLKKSNSVDSKNIIKLICFF